MKIKITKIFNTKKVFNLLFILFFILSFTSKSFATWSYTTGVLTSTGATEASPDSLLAGIAIVQAADATRGYRNGNIAWVNNVDVIISGNSFIKADNDSAIDWRGASGIRGASDQSIIGGFIGGASAKFTYNVTTSRFGAFGNGATFITERRNPQDPAFAIYQNGTVRVDFPSFGSIGVANTLAEIDVNGLDLYTNTSSTNILTNRFYAGATVSNVRDVRGFDRFGNDSLTMLLYGATYTNSYFENLYAGSEQGLINTVNLVSPTFYKTTQGAFIGLLRSATFVLTNPSILNNAWNGTTDFRSENLATQSKFSIQYSYINTFKSGLTNLSGVNVRFTRARQSANNNPTWTVPNATMTATSNASGQYTAVNLLDTYREGTSVNQLERFNWTAKARKYDKKTAGETVFSSRVLYQHSINMSAGYSEEVQMLDVPYLTLTEAQATALTGIAFTPSGANGGTVTISSARTIAELWQSYRAWIATLANFDSEDTWSYDGETLNMGAWNVTINSGGSLTNGKLITTGAVTINGGTANINYLDQNGDSILTLGGVSPSSFVEVFNQAGTLIASSTGMTSYRYLSNPSTKIRIKVTQTDGSFLEQDYYLLAGENTLSFAFGGTVFTAQDRATLNTILSIVNSIWGKVSTLPSRIASYFDIVQVLR